MDYFVPGKFISDMQVFSEIFLKACFFFFFFFYVEAKESLERKIGLRLRKIWTEAEENLDWGLNKIKISST